MLPGKASLMSYDASRVSAPTAIRVSNLSKAYQVGESPGKILYKLIAKDLRRRFLPFLSEKLPLVASQDERTILALNDVSFEVKKGETFGVIGRNGGGKSTLLQLICGTLDSTSGEVVVNGRIAALLELGSGFNPEFTGLENVQLNASILGLSSAEIERKLPEILAFAEIPEFINLPVKTYSTGMMVRLAFSVIAHVDADVLIVDEALSVGDVFFTQKCMRFLESFKAKGGTILFVSHDTAAVVALCQRALLLVQGRKVFEGSAKEVTQEYLAKYYASSNEVIEAQGNAKKLDTGDTNTKAQRRFSVESQEENFINVSTFNENAASIGLGGVRIANAYFEGQDGEVLTSMQTNSSVVLVILIDCVKEVHTPAVGIAIKDRLGQSIFTETTTFAFSKYYQNDGLSFLAGDQVEARFKYTMPVLREGEYVLTLAVASGLGHAHVQEHLIYEGLVLKVIGSRVVHGVAALANLDTEIQISRS
jgi:lipopolysaccharide transport system ATP-binding protein